MPLQDGKKKLVIVDNLSLVVDKLLSRISDESEAGCAELVRIIKTAQERYNETGGHSESESSSILSWAASVLVGSVTSFVHQFTRTRSDKIDLAVQSIKQFPDAYTRLQEFKILVGTGEWYKDSSFNYYFFDELIHSLPGYEPLTEELRYGVILRVRDLIREQIDSFIVIHKANLKLIATKEQELQQTQQSNQRVVDKVFIAYDLESAKKSTTCSPIASSSSPPLADRIQFSLTMQDKVWKLHWVDVLGKAYSLEPSEELIKLLINKKPDDLEELKPVAKKRLKQECLAARNLFLDRIQVSINPKDSKTNRDMNIKAWAQQGHVNTFVIRGKNGNYNLCWINALGKGMNITLSKHLGSWLKEKESLTEDDVYQLIPYLMYVDTSKAIGREDFKLQLKNCLEKRPPPPKIEVADNQPKKLDMSLFADIARVLANSPTRLAAASASQASRVDEGSELPSQTDKEKLPKAATPGKLNLDKFSLVTQSLGHKSSAAKKEPTEDDIEERHEETFSM